MSAERVATPLPPALRAGVHPPSERLLAEWEELADRTGASPFRRPGWTRIWAESFSRAPLLLLGVRRGARLAALLPLAKRRGALRSPTNFHTPDYGALAEDAEAADLLYRSLLALPHHQLSLGMLEGEGDDSRRFLAAARARGERTLVRVLQRPPVLELKGVDPAAPEALLDAKLRADLRRRGRRLREAGEVSVQLADGSEGLDSLLAEGFRVEGSGWKEARGTAIGSLPETRRFYREMAAWAAGRGILRLAFLRLDGRAVAFQLGVEEGGAYWFLKGGYDAACRPFAPGKLLVREVLARVAGRGVERFEFLGDAEEWKSEWTTACRTRVAASAFAPGLPGYAGWLANRYGRPAARRVLLSYRGWRDRRAARASQPHRNDA